MGSETTNHVRSHLLLLKIDLFFSDWIETKPSGSAVMTSSAIGQEKHEAVPVGATRKKHLSGVLRQIGAILDPVQSFHILGDESIRFSTFQEFSGSGQLGTSIFLLSTILARVGCYINLLLLNERNGRPQSNFVNE